MSYQTRSSSGSWQQVSAPVDYAGVVSNYSAQFINAQIAQQNRDLEEKALAYRDGTLSYKDFVDYMNTQLGTVTPGSAQELNLKQALVATQDYERNQQIAIKRSELEAKYAKDGISADEQLKIEKAILPLYKAGSADYSQQLANVAKAQDLKNQEDKNIKVAALQAKLSQGGLTTGEQIQVYNEALSMTDKNSQDYQKITGQINQLKEQKRVEDQANAQNAAVSQLLNQYKVGGLSNDELLTINRTMQKFTDPGTPAFINLQEEEAKLLGAGANGGGSGGSGGSGGGAGVAGLDKNQVTAQLAVAQQKMQELEQRFQNGAISDQEYLQGKQQLLDSQTNLLGQLGQGITKDAALTKQQALLQEQSQQFQEATKLYSEGKAVTIKTPKGQAIIPIDQAQAYASQNVDILDGNGNPIKASVLTTNTGGVEKQFVVQPGGSFELLKTNDNGSSQATGFIVKSIKTAPGVASGPLPFISPTPFGSPLQNVAQGIAAVPGQIAKGVQSVLNPTPTKNGASAPSSLLTNLSNSVIPAAKSATATSLFGPVGGIVNNYSSQINKAVSSVGSSLSSAFKPVSNTLSNIGNSVVSGAKNALSSVKSFFGF